MRRRLCLDATCSASLPRVFSNAQERQSSGGWPTREGGASVVDELGSASSNSAASNWAEIVRLKVLMAGLLAAAQRPGSLEREGDVTVSLDEGRRSAQAAPRQARQADRRRGRRVRGVTLVVVVFGRGSGSGSGERHGEGPGSVVMVTTTTATTVLAPR